MTMSNSTIWLIIIGLGIGTFVLRFSFLGLIGRKPMPEWVLRLLRYTPVAVIPGLMAPAVLLPNEGEALPDLPTLVAVLVTLAVGLWSKKAIWAMGAGAAALVAMVLITGH